MEISRDMMLEMYRRMVRIREFEDTSINLFLRGELKGAATTYNGMEASAVGVCMALRREDLIAGTHRGHGLELTWEPPPVTHGNTFGERAHDLGG